MQPPAANSYCWHNSCYESTVYKHYTIVLGKLIYTTKHTDCKIYTEEELFFFKLYLVMRIALSKNLQFSTIDYCYKLN